MEKTHFFRGYQPGSGRHNAAGVDINRDFPSWNETSKTRADLEAGRAPETELSSVLDPPRSSWFLATVFWAASLAPPRKPMP